LTWSSELLLHVDRRGRDEDVQARPLGVPDGFPRPIDVREPGAGQAGDGRAAHALGDGLDGLEVTRAGDREAGLDDVDAEMGELLGDLELLGHVQRDAGRLLAVPQRGVEDPYFVHLGLPHPFFGFRQRKTSPARRHEEASASTGRRSQLGKEQALGAQLLRQVLGHDSHIVAALQRRVNLFASARDSGRTK
jgi:hypothetical protein